jgi:acylphosphatase
MPVRRYLVEGIVQGVGFRHFVRNAARRLGLKGIVRNLPDGRVEALAEGGEAPLQAFENALRQGPPASRVTSVTATQEADPPAVSGFEVR